MSQIQNQEYFNTAKDLAFQLVRDAVWYQKRCCWTGHELDVVDGQYKIIYRSFGADIYNGSGGIVFFLASFYAYEQDPMVAKTIEGGIANMLQVLKDDDSLSHFAYYSGKAGIAHTLYRVAKIMNRPDWKAAALVMFDEMTKHSPTEMEIDVISGVAGSIPALLDMYQNEGKDDYLNTAIRCGDFLINKAVKNDDGWTWITLPGSSYGLTGYSHGNSGIATALLELYYQTGNVSFWEASRMGFLYEKAWYQPDQHNWPDLREYDPQKGGKPACNHAWCHGAPGIALSRMRAYQLTKFDAFKEEALQAIHATVVNTEQLLKTTGSNYSLCHGMAGNTYVLYEAALVFENENYRQLAEKVCVHGIQHYGKWHLTWPSGVNDPSGKTKGQQETPGLMMGLAGTAYFYLQMAVKDQLINPLIAKPFVKTEVPA